MINIPSLRAETRYGIPPADQYLFNRDFIIGYSYLFRQPRWSLQLIRESSMENNIDDRLDNFRPDLRVPTQFRTSLDDYRGSGFDRGHLVPSADTRASNILNSESFLLTNMSPQQPRFNRGVWKELEEQVRKLYGHDNIVEIYAMSGPLFDIGKAIQTIGDDQSDNTDVYIPVPHAYFKSILAEKLSGKFSLWSFILPNEECQNDLSDYRVTTLELEQRAGLPLWDRISGDEIGKIKKRKSRMW